MKKLCVALCLLSAATSCSLVEAQSRARKPASEQCATMLRLNQRLARNPALKSRFDRQLQTFNRMASLRGARPLGSSGTTAIYTIPVVFHIVLSNQNLVSDAQIATQLSSLNNNFAGLSADSTDIPSYFKSLFGKSTIRFCLAQRTPDGESSTGIDRVTTTKTSFSASDDGVKHATAGGADIWDGTKYLNVWVCSLADNLLGYGTFPDDGSPGEQGVVIEYRSLPGGAFANYNEGKTLTHETGHYFNLYHIWGDDDGECSGTDYIDDTPNQGNSSSGCSSGQRTDDCTATGNGVLYEDYMDYSYDACMLLFTRQQVERMESALLTYRSTLTTSDGCSPVVDRNLDAQLKSVLSPARRICANTFSPVINVVNRGAKTLSSLLITTVVDNGPAVVYTWKGTLPSLGAAKIDLDPLTVTSGNHLLKIYLSAPNGLPDENRSNDTLSVSVQYYDLVSTISEGFEGSNFPPRGWDIVNADQSLTWKKVTGIAKTGTESVMMNNFDYSDAGEQDYLRMPELNLTDIDSAYLSFQLAASTFSATGNSGNNWDTLELLISKDCGVSYTSLYKKWAGTLTTTAGETTRAFEPTSTEWRLDSVNLTPYINAGPFMLAFRNTTEYENNIYLDDINLKTQVINPNLRKSGFLVTPNPTAGNLTVQFFPNPATLKSIQLYNMLGQKLSELTVASGQGATSYNFNISAYPPGTFIVRAVFSDKVLTRKIIKQ